MASGGSLLVTLNLIFRCKVVAHHGKDGLPSAIRSGDVILLMPEELDEKNLTPEEELKLQGKRVIELAGNCSRHAPKAILIVCVPPVSMTLPLVASVYRRTHWYNPGRLVGSVALAQVREGIVVNEVAFFFLTSDPSLDR